MGGSVNDASTGFSVPTSRGPTSGRAPRSFICGASSVFALTTTWSPGFACTVDVQLSSGMSAGAAAKALPAPNTDIPVAHMATNPVAATAR
jgi:hypothetical protein